VKARAHPKVAPPIMPPTGSSSIILCADVLATVDDVRQTLHSAGFTADFHPLGGTDPLVRDGVTLVLIDGSGCTNDALKLCQRLRAGPSDNFTPILYVTADASPGARLSCLEAGADAYLLRPFDPAELLAQARALLRIKDRHDTLTARAAEVQRINKRLQAAYQQIDLELDLARRIQESFLPKTLPELQRVRFAVKYKPCGRVGGDFYDVFRLDENHLGFYVADAMGHGVAASLLSVFVKKGVHAKEINGNDYRLVPPNEVLQRLNRDLIDQALSESPFITMAYFLFNMRDGTLQFARAGHPYPLYLPGVGAPQLWQTEGSLLGVFDVQYRLQTHNLQPGDKVLLYTDGIDGAGFGNQPLGLPSLLAAAAHYRDLHIGDLVDRLALSLFGHGPPTDDLTILGMEVVG
jgi:sigma-B regulation protein RsbU (phosphoserine phosphatase)